MGISYLRVVKFLCLILVMMWGSYSNTLSVKDFSATGNGSTDDTQAINACLAAAHTQNKNVFFPSGTYLCNKEDVNANLLVYNASGQNNITIYGNLSNGQPTATILTTKDTATTQLNVTASAPCANITISGIAFSNTHGKINFITDAIFLQGTAGQEITGATISKCSFNGYSQAIAGQGVNGWAITENNFGAPNGHDNGTQNSTPCVGIWLFDNSNGYVLNPDIERNTASGYTGSLPMTCKRPSDGFVYGTAYGWTIKSNTTSNFSEEHYLIQPWGTKNGDTTLPCLIQANNADCHLPPGSINDDGSPHKINYGIRSDVCNSKIINNTIINYTWGIMVYAPSYPTQSLHSYEIAFNNLSMASVTDTNYTIQMGIIVQGNSVPITSANLHDNTAHLTDTAYISLISCTSPQNVNNKYTPGN